MRPLVLLLTQAAAAACTAPTRPRSAEGHAEPERLATPPVAVAAADPVAEWPRPEPSPENPFARPGIDDTGEFLVVLRQSHEPPETNPYVTDDRMEMVANYMMDDARASRAVEETLKSAGMELAGSGGHGHIGLYVRYEEAERARRLLMRVPGAEIPLPVEVPPGQPGVFWNLPAPPAKTPYLDLVAGTLCESAPTFDRAVALVAAAGITTHVMPRHGTRSLLVPTVRAADARRLLRMLDGVAEAPLDGPPPDADLLVFPSPRAALPPAGPGMGESWEDVAYFVDSDALAAERVWGALDRAGISCLAISNAGGASTKVGAPFANRARLILRLVAGARLERGFEEEVLGEFWIDGVDLSEITDERGKAPRPGPGREWIAVHDVHDLGTAHMVAAALEIGGFDASGVTERREQVLGSERISRLSVPASEAPAARRLIRLLPGGERIVR